MPHRCSKRPATPAAANRPAARSLALAIHLLALGGAFALSGWVPDARAQAAGAAASLSRSYDIPAGPLSTALTRFSREAGVYLVGAGNAAEGKTSAGLKGSYSVSGGFAALLAGTGLEAFEQGDGSYGLRAAQSEKKKVQIVPSANEATLPTVQVQGSAVSSATTEGSGSYGADAATVAGKLPVPLKDIPSSVSVVTRQQMDDRNLRTFEDAMNTVTGVSIPINGAGGPDFFSRGYELQVQYDGVPASNVLGDYNPQFDMAMYDRVEVLRGPSGLLQGSGEPGGSVNLVRKRPLKEFSINGSVSAGSKNNFANDIDVTGPLNKDGSLRGRFVAADQTRNMYWGAKDWHALAYGILEYDLTPRDTLSFTAAYQRSRRSPFWTGLPAKNGQLWDTSTSTFLGADWSYSQANTLELTADETHRFDNGWSSHAVYTHRVMEPEVLSASQLAGSGITDISSALRFTTANVKSRKQWDGFDIYAGGPFDLFGRTHELVFGANLDHYQLRQDSGYGGMVADVFNASAIPEPSLTSGSRTDTLQYGLYGQLRYKLLDSLTAVIGTRVSWFRNKTQDVWPTPSDWSDQGVAHHRATPFAGLIYDVTRDVSIYGSYTDIFVPQTELTMGGSVLPPRIGSEYEIGTKGSFLNKRLNASLALFNIEDKNRAYNDPDDPTGTYYLAAGKVRSRGVEAEVGGQITPSWNIIVGYTYLQTKYLKDTYSEGMAFNPAQPEHTLKLWTNYRFTSPDLMGLSLGGGMNFFSSLKSQTTPVLEQGPVAVFGAQIGYDINKHLSATLTINNLFNKKYYQRVSYLGNSNYFGEPRNVMLNLRLRY
ncbi:MAG: TonB-dependent siderophore receptor [Acidovorax sp.]